MIYFDYAATTPVDKEILASYIKASEHFFANTSSLHYLGREAQQMYLQATNDILNTLELKNHNIIFTANATEANNIAILSYVKRFKKGRIITTKVEHASVYEVMRSLEESFDVIYLDVDSSGQISIDDLKQAINKETILISIMWVNNIVGSIMDIKSIIEEVKKHPSIKLHVDTVQGLGKTPANFDLNDIDLFSFSAHKLYGPKGVGLLFFNKNLVLEKISYGSSVQHGLRPGTFDLSLVVACAKTIKKYYPQTKMHLTYVRSLFTYIINGLKNNPKIKINSSLENSSPYIINISIPNINGEVLVRSLEQEKIYVSTGSACSSKLNKPERSLLAMTKDEELAKSALRISLSHLLSLEDVEKLLNVLNKI